MNTNQTDVSEFTLNTDLKPSIAALQIDKKGVDMNYSYQYNQKPNDIFAMAKAFLTLGAMTHKKLQKLCYYAKAWYLVIYDQNIIREQFEAWVHGAVQPDLYYKYREYGFSDIPRNTDTSQIPEEYLSFAKEVYDAYGHLSGDDLEALNHQEDPWKEARKNCKPWEACSNIITEESMKKYYRGLMKET